MRDARTLEPALEPVAENVPGFAAPFEALLLDAVVPESAPAGNWEIVAAFFDPAGPVAGRGDAFMEAAAEFAVE